MQSETERHEELKRRLLEASLAHVVFDGWSRRALQAGAQDCGVDPTEVERHFPGGPADLIRFFSAEADRTMLSGLAGLPLAELRVRDKVAAAVRLRLEALEPHREAVRRGLAFFAQPDQAGLGVACLYRTVDAVWHGVGDRSTDYNFYSKRLLLSGVFSATLLAWLNDESPDKEATWAFLDRRISEVLKIGGRFGKTFGQLLALPERLFAKAGHGRGPFARRGI